MRFYCVLLNKQIGILLIYYWGFFHSLDMSHADFHEQGKINHYFKNVFRTICARAFYNLFPIYQSLQK